MPSVFPFMNIGRRAAPLLIVAAVGATVQQQPVADDTSAAFRSESLRGRVVWMNDVLEERLGVKPVIEARQRVLALETAEGRLHPLIEDSRGRAFRTDERLRDVDVELLVRVFPIAPAVQVLRVFAIEEDGSKAELAYWCDICAITSYELGPCACCQGPVVLERRKQPK